MQENATLRTQIGDEKTRNEQAKAEVAISRMETQNAHSQRQIDMENERAKISARKPYIQTDAIEEVRLESDENYTQHQKREEIVRRDRFTTEELQQYNDMRERERKIDEEKTKYQRMRGDLEYSFRHRAQAVWDTVRRDMNSVQGFEKPSLSSVAEARRQQNQAEVMWLVKDQFPELEQVQNPHEFYEYITAIGYGPSENIWSYFENTHEGLKAKKREIDELELIHNSDLFTQKYNQRLRTPKHRDELNSTIAATQNELAANLPVQEAPAEEPLRRRPVQEPVQEEAPPPEPPQEEAPPPEPPHRVLGLQREPTSAELAEINAWLSGQRQQQQEEEQATQS
jgi:hypothetical protein